jgi:uncharacterized protein YllA (UPF0747 family)
MKAPLLSWALPGAAPGSLALDAPAPKHLPSALLDRWRAALSAWDAPAAVRSQLDVLADPRTEVIVTGQQPGMWGGPLYSMYKAATAVALAERRTRSLGIPTAAVFWINADDTDWDEVAWGAVPLPDLSLFRARWEASPGARRWVGGARVSEPAGAREAFGAWASAGPLLGGPRGQDPAELGDAVARTRLAGVGDRGLVPLDARWPEVRATGESLWRDYLPRHAALAAAVRAQGEALRRLGEPAPIDDDAAERGLFILEDDRRLAPDAPEWAAGVRALLDRGEAAQLAPSVLLRAVLQDRMFGTSAHVVGDAEAAYLKQLAPVFEALSVRPPVRVPRLRATVVPEGLAPLERIAEVCADPEAWLSEEARALIPAATARAIEDLRSDLAVRLGEIAASSTAFLKDMGQLTESARAKMDAQAHRLEEALDRRARQRLYQERPMLRNLSEFLRPRRAPQERGLSAATLPLFLGESAPRAAMDTAHAHLARLDEGVLHHFVLEGNRD